MFDIEITPDPIKEVPLCVLLAPGVSPTGTPVICIAGVLPGGRAGGYSDSARRVEQSEFCSIGGVESGVPLIEVGACDRFAVPGWRRVSYLDAPPEFIRRNLEVVQFDADSEFTSRCTQLVTFDSRPKPEVEHHAHAKPQDVLSQVPELPLDLLADVPVPRARAEGPLPLILRPKPADRASHHDGARHGPVRQPARIRAGRGGSATGALLQQSG